MSWSSLWAYFKVATNEIKADIWKELDLIRHLKGLDTIHQIMVLENAPDDVLKLVENALYLETRIKLGLQEKKPVPVKKLNVIRMVIG